MNNSFDNQIAMEMLAPIKQRLASLPESDSEKETTLRSSSLDLLEFASLASSSCEELATGAETLASVLELAASWLVQGTAEQDAVLEMALFVDSNLSVLQSATQTGDVSVVSEFVQFAHEQWAEYLNLIGDEQESANAWAADRQPQELEIDEVSTLDIELLLSAVSESEPAELAIPAPEMEMHSDSDSDEVAKQELLNDRELLEAFLDDSDRCLSSMELAALAIEESPENDTPVQQFCRELHTLKGASATVGLSKLATYIHEVESTIESGDAVQADLMFAAVDFVRTEIVSLKSASSPQETDATSAKPTEIKEFNSYVANDDSSIRIRASQLDRLMDMLAELVVLRNRRESHVVEFNVFNEELARCASRLSLAEPDEFEFLSAAQSPSHGMATNVTEIAKDIEAVSHGLRLLQKPVSQDNTAISGFIRDFRQELMQLRRIPVSGLFNRLQRAARDVAKSEGKQIQIELIGEQAGLEQEIQEKLFESLLHIIRNSVSHGIETPDARQRAGKPAAGKVTLEACSNAQLLIIEVRDDGNGLDYSAVKRRAIEKGLITTAQRPTNDELASLIFHPGFSTRETATQVSGRGVGMDIVATTIEQLHGRIEIDSVAGQGTTMRLLIPLRTGIEHVMVFRSNGQLYALPMQSVTAVKASGTGLGNITKVLLANVLTPNSKIETGNEDVLVLRTANEFRRQSGDDDPQTRLGMAVDELIGPEEVVVRGLPNLLKHHPLFCGVTLSGSGEKVLLLDSERVIEFCREFETEEPTGRDNSEKSSNKLRALVVDDSLTARKMLTKHLQKNNFVTTEAGDGNEAIERLHQQRFDLVLTDLDMPNLGGLELLLDIQTGQYCDCPVVVVSSRAEETFRFKAMDLGAVDYIKKPISDSAIANVLETLQLLPKVLESI